MTRTSTHAMQISSSLDLNTKNSAVYPRFPNSNNIKHQNKPVNLKSPLRGSQPIYNGFLCFSDQKLKPTSQMVQFLDNKSFSHAKDVKLNSHRDSYRRTTQLKNYVNINDSFESSNNLHGSNTSFFKTRKFRLKTAQNRCSYKTVQASISKKNQNSMNKMLGLTREN